MSDQELLQEAIAALAQAASEEQPIRFGHDVARVLHAALLDAGDRPEHDHAWLSLGWDRLAGRDAAMVIQACACGEVRQMEARELT